MNSSRPGINLIDWRVCNNSNRFDATDEFKVESMSNTTVYRAGSFLTLSQVNELIDISNFNVKIRQPRNSDFD